MADTRVIAAAELRKLLEYNPETGRLTWVARPLEMFSGHRAAYRQRCWNTRYAGKEAFTAVSSGYRQGRIHGVAYSAHRVVWAIHFGAWPTGQIDHINGDRADNRIANLRDVSQADNLRNAKKNKANTTGHTGVYRVKGRWIAQIYTNGKTHHLGTFDTLNEAVSSRAHAAGQAGFHRNHGKR